VATAVEGFRKEMRRLQEEPVPAEELEVAKSYLIGSFPLGFERAARRAGYLISAEVHQFPQDALERLLESFAGVSAEDVQRVARLHLHPGQCSISVSGPVSAREIARIARESAAQPTH
jgi:zinc protease